MAYFWTYFDKFSMPFAKLPFFVNGQILKNSLPIWSHWVWPDLAKFGQLVQIWEVFAKILNV